ncbi:probable glutamate receptor isoform X2 [Cryptotermes secundus]|nr:probable glutamate receptor isoform X2 [Cryptotermes secundus]
MVRAFESDARRRCVTQRSIYVILRGNKDTRTYINQTFSVAYSSRAVWLLFLDTNAYLEEFFTDINIPFDCEFLVAQSQNGDVIALTEVYRVSPTLPLQTYRFGNWSPGGGLTWPSQGFYQRRNNLQGHVIRATYKSEPITVNVVKEANGSYKTEGYFGQIWGIMADLVNATPVYQAATSYGSKSGNGSWSGMVALVSSGEADIGIGDFTATAERSHVVEFIDTVEFSSIKVFIKIPNSSDMVWNSYVAPFSYGLWLAVAISGCALCVCLTITNFSHDGQKEKQSLMVSETVFYIFGCLCQQGQREAVNRTAGRIVTLTAYVMSLVIFVGYSASLISSLAVQPRNLPFRDLQGLLYDGSYSLGVLQNSSFLNIFDGAVGGLESEVYKKLIGPFKSDLPSTNDEAFERVCTRNRYAYMCSHFFSQIVPCQLVALPGTSYPETLTYIITKNNPYKSLINWRLAQVRESGLQERIRQRYITLKKPDADRSTTTVGLLAIAPILVVFAAGNIMSAFVLMIERCIRGNAFRLWLDGNIRRPYNNEYQQLVRIRRHPRIHVMPNRRPLRVR